MERKITIGRVIERMSNTDTAGVAPESIEARAKALIAEESRGGDLPQPLQAVK